MVSKRLKYLFFGSTAFAVETARLFIEEGGDAYQCVGLVCQPDKPQKRGRLIVNGPMKQWGLKHKIPVFQPDKMKDFMDTLVELKPDFGVVVAYGKILPNPMLEREHFFPLGIYNFHSSLLPRHRGASPIRAALAAGDTVTGISIQRITEEMDAGPVWLTHEMPIEARDTFGTLEARMTAELPALVRAFCQKFPPPEDDLAVQNESQATYCFKDKPTDWVFELGSETMMWQKFRAFLPQPGAWLTFQGRRLVKIIDVTYQKHNAVPHAASHLVIKNKKTLGLAFNDGHEVLITRLQNEGKPQQNALDWINGHRQMIEALKKPGVLYEM